jgi:glycosyltransferase involved in cell wall biosynthesis
MPTLSAIIITKNESFNIEACLTSVSFADEIIVVDAGSHDDTVAICRRFTDQVFVTDDWLGFGAQKNLALAKATQEWVLSIDADERVSLALQAEIKQAINSQVYSAFNIPRQSYYCGRWLKHGGWFPDQVIRLFRRDTAQFSADEIHERVVLVDETKAQIGALTHPLQHYSFHSLEQVIDKINLYSTANASKYYKRGKKASLKKAIFHGLWAFMRTYFFQAGFLDGREGFMLAVSNAEGTYYRYLKLMYLQENNEKNQPNHHNL